VEIAKNLVMSGLKRITLHDSKKTTFVDLAGTHQTLKNIGRGGGDLNLIIFILHNFQKPKIQVNSILARRTLERIVRSRVSRKYANSTIT